MGVSTRERAATDDWSFDGRVQWTQRRRGVWGFPPGLERWVDGLCEGGVEGKEVVKLLREHPVERQKASRPVQEHTDSLRRGFVDGLFVVSMQSRESLTGTAQTPGLFVVSETAAPDRLIALCATAIWTRPSHSTSQ